MGKESELRLIVNNKRTSRGGRRQPFRVVASVGKPVSCRPDGGGASGSVEGQMDDDFNARRYLGVVGEFPCRLDAGGIHLRRSRHGPDEELDQRRDQEPDRFLP